MGPIIFQNVHKVKHQDAFLPAIAFRDSLTTTTPDLGNNENPNVIQETPCTDENLSFDEHGVLSHGQINREERRSQLIKIGENGDRFK